MSGYLLDVNALVALLWPPHRSHAKVQSWFSAHRRHGWATSAMTQAGFVRVASNRVFSVDALTPMEAVHALKTNTAAADHVFWSDDVALTGAVEYAGARLIDHHHVTGAYLLGLSIQRGGVLATLDRGMASLVGSDPIAAASLTIIE